MNAECSVCCENFNSNSAEIISTQCGHIFHLKCIDTWLKNSKTCPQCRQRTEQRDLRRLYFNINLNNSSRVDLNSTANATKMVEKERTITTLRELKSKNEKEIEKLKNEVKHGSEKISALDRQIKTMHTSKEKLKTDLIRAAEKSQRDMLKMQSGLSAVQTELEKTELKLKQAQIANTASAASRHDVRSPRAHHASAASHHDARPPRAQHAKASADFDDSVIFVGSSNAARFGPLELSFSNPHQYQRAPSLFSPCRERVPHRRLISATRPFDADRGSHILNNVNWNFEHSSFGSEIDMMQEWLEGGR